MTKPAINPFTVYYLKILKFLIVKSYLTKLHQAKKNSQSL